MKYKHIPVSKTLFLRVPENLTPDEEANYIASRIAFVNFEELEADCRASLKLIEEGPAILMEDVLAELTQDANKDGQNG